MKKGFMLVAALLLVLGLAALPGAAAAESTGVEVVPGYDWSRFDGQGVTLNVYNWGEYISTGTDGESLDVNAEFEALTGITVNYTMFDTNESLRAKLKSGGANYDVIIPSDYMIGQLASEGMLEALDFTNIPNFSMIGEAYKGRDYDPQNRYSVPYMWGTVGIIYNTTMVSAVPNSWAALWDEQYKGNVLMFDNSRDAMGIAFKKLGMPLNPATTADIDRAAAELLAQKSVVQAYVMDQIFDKMEGGEAALAPYYAGDAITMIEENPDLAFVVPKEGTNYFVDAMCVPKGTANQTAAEMYINFMCEPEISVANCLYVGYSTPNTVAESLLPEEVRGNPIAYPPAEVLANTETFTVLSDELNAHMDKAWGDMRGGSQNGGGWVIPVALVALVVVVVLVVWRGKAKKKKNLY